MVAQAGQPDQNQKPNNTTPLYPRQANLTDQLSGALSVRLDSGCDRLDCNRDPNVKLQEFKDHLRITKEDRTDGADRSDKTDRDRIVDPIYIGWGQQQQQQQQQQQGVTRGDRTKGAKERRGRRRRTRKKFMSPFEEGV